MEKSRLNMTDAQAMLEDCVKRYQKLNEWERGFIDSLNKTDTEKMSPRQYEILEVIWERIT